jgi:hypothetical protein
MVEGAGCKGIFTQDGITRDQMSPGIDVKANPNGYVGFAMWMPFLKEELLKLKPDIAVIDFFTVPAFIACDELGIQVVSNMPFPLNMMNAMGIRFPNKTNTSNCCGFLCVRETAFDWVFSNIVVRKGLPAKEWQNHLKNIPSRIQMNNSFWGFNSPQPLPPNFILTGPLMK